MEKKLPFPLPFNYGSSEPVKPDFCAGSAQISITGGTCATALHLVADCDELPEQPCTPIVIGDEEVACLDREKR